MNIQGSQLQSVMSYLQSKTNTDITADEKALLVTLQGADQVKGVTLSPSQAAIANACLNKYKDLMPFPSADLDFNGAIKTMTNLENLMLLMSSLSRTLREAKFHEAQNLLAAKTKDLLASADLKTQGAEEMRSNATISMVIGIVAGSISIAGGIFSLVKLDGVGDKLDQLEDLADSGEDAATMALRETLNKSIDINIQTIGAVSKLTDGFAQVANSVGGKFSAEGQAANQESQAEADRKQAVASQKEILAKQQQDMENLAKDLLNKMTDMLKALHEAKQKAVEAAARA